MTTSFVLYHCVGRGEEPTTAYNTKSHNTTKAIHKTDSITQNMAREQKQVYLTDLVDWTVTPTPQVAG